MEILIKKDLLGFKNQFHNFGEGLTPTMIALLNLDPAEVAKLIKVRDLVNFIFAQQDIAQEHAQNMSKYQQILFHGLNGEVLGPIPSAPAYPAVLPDVTEGNAFKQFSDFVQDCKRSPNFTSNVAEGLGVLAPEVEFDPAAGTPLIKVELTALGHPRIHLKNKSEYDGMEVWKLVTQAAGQTSGASAMPPPPIESAAFKKMERVFGVNYTDPEPLPAFGKAEVWHYKVIYLLKNEVAGHFSTIYSVTVTGMV